MFQQIFMYLLFATVAYSVDLTGDTTEAINNTEEQQNFTFLAYLPQSYIGRDQPIDRPSSSKRPSRTRLLVSAYPSSWLNALSNCYAMNGVLVSINNAELDTTIRYALISQGIVGQIWTSGRYEYTGEPRHLTLFLWAGNGQDFSYTNWNVVYGQPAVSWGYNTCVAVAQQGYSENKYKWETANCENQLKFICVI